MLNKKIDVTNVSRETLLSHPCMEQLNQYILKCTEDVSSAEQELEVLRKFQAECKKSGNKFNANVKNLETKQEIEKCKENISNVEKNRDTSLTNLEHARKFKAQLIELFSQLSSANSNESVQHTSDDMSSIIQDTSKKCGPDDHRFRIEIEQYVSRETL